MFENGYSRSSKLCLFNVKIGYGNKPVRTGSHSSFPHSSQKLQTLAACFCDCIFVFHIRCYQAIQFLIKSVLKSIINVYTLRTQNTVHSFRLILHMNQFRNVHIKCLQQSLVPDLPKNQWLSLERFRLVCFIKSVPIIENSIFSWCILPGALYAHEK